MGPRAAVLALTLGLGVPALARANGCETVSVGLDTTEADHPIVDTYSNQAAQIFEAPDTILTAITVWVVPTFPYNSHGKLYVMEVDTTGGIVYPNEKKLLLDGATLQTPAADGVHPAEVTWVIDPPLVLPRRGQFAFEIVPIPCAGGELTVFVGRSGDPYPGGSYWNFDTASCGPGCCPDNPWDGTIDLAFRADFCELPVATRPETWGSLKAAYR